MTDSQDSAKKAAYKVGKGKLDPKYNFKPGQSGNPNGRPKLPPELKAVKALTADEINRMISKYTRMSKAELREAIESPDTPALELMIASGIANGIKTGDYSKIAFLLDRTIGKVKDSHEIINRSEKDAELDKIPKEKLALLLRDGS